MAFIRKGANVLGFMIRELTGEDERKLRRPSRSAFTTRNCGR
jgi:hypothetical protein